MRTYAARAPVNARVSASASVKSATNASAPLLTKLCNLFALLPTTRTFCLLASRVLAMIEPVLPVAPRMVYIKSPFKALRWTLGWEMKVPAEEPILDPQEPLGKSVLSLKFADKICRHKSL